MTEVFVASLFSIRASDHLNGDEEIVRHVKTDFPLADDAKKIREWCVKNGKSTYTGVVNSVLGSAIKKAAAAAGIDPARVLGSDILSGPVRINGPQIITSTRPDNLFSPPKGGICQNAYSEVI